MEEKTFKPHEPGEISKEPSGEPSEKVLSSRALLLRIADKLGVDTTP